VVVVDNASSTHGWPGGVQTRFAVEGWSVRRVSGRDHDALEAALTARHPGRPHMVAAVVEPKFRPAPQAGAAPGSVPGSAAAPAR
jgi:transketolase